MYIKSNGSKFSCYISKGSIRADVLDRGAKRGKSLSNDDSDYEPESKRIYKDEGEFRYLYCLFRLDDTSIDVNLFFTCT